MPALAGGSWPVGVTLRVSGLLATWGQIDGSTGTAHPDVPLKITFAHIHLMPAPNTDFIGKESQLKMFWQ